MKSKIIQLNYKLGDFEQNVTKMIKACELLDPVDLVIYSELCLSGYYPLDLINMPIFMEKQTEALGIFKHFTKFHPNTYFAIGAVTLNKTGIGKKFHNSLLLINNGNVVLQYNKQLLPTYEIFDESRHFESGSDQKATFTINGTKCGFIICEDGWNDNKTDYATNPITQIVNESIDTLITINASPSNVEKYAKKIAMYEAISQKYEIDIIYANQVGANDQIVFDGGSFYTYFNQGQPSTYAMPQFVEANHTFDSNKKLTFISSPVIMPNSEFYYNQIKLGFKDYMTKCGFTKVVVGCSGGIDSALTLALAKDTLSAENVIAVTMPSKYSSSGSVSDSEILCQNLGIKLYTHPIKDIYDQYTLAFKSIFNQPLTGLADENVQPRIRATILMEYSNQFGAMLLTTGNKSELSVGYSTIYGDLSGGLNLIGDLYKMEVFELSKWYNTYHNQEIIPNAIIDKPPSAELAEGQLDSNALPEYPILDAILKTLIEPEFILESEKVATAKIMQKLLTSTEGLTTIKKMERLIHIAEYKRFQAPPIIRLRGRAFGNGRQIPITCKLNSAF